MLLSSRRGFYHADIEVAERLSDDNWRPKLISPGTISGIMCFIVKSRRMDEVPMTGPHSGW